MIQNHIRQVALTRGLKSAYELQRALDLSPTVAQRMWYGKTTRWSNEVLDKLCVGLNCQVGDLLVYVPRKKGKKKS